MMGRVLVGFGVFVTMKILMKKSHLWPSSSPFQQKSPASFALLTKPPIPFSPHPSYHPRLPPQHPDPTQKDPPNPTPPTFLLTQISHHNSCGPIPLSTYQYYTITKDNSASYSESFQPQATVNDNHIPLTIISADGISPLTLRHCVADPGPYIQPRELLCSNPHNEMSPSISTLDFFPKGPTLFWVPWCLPEIGVVLEIPIVLMLSKTRTAVMICDPY